MNFPDYVIAKSGYKAVVTIADKNHTITSFTPFSLKKYDAEDLDKSSSLKSCMESGLLVPYIEGQTEIAKRPIQSATVPNLNDGAKNSVNIKVTKNLDGSLKVDNSITEDIIKRAAEATQRGREALQNEKVDYGADDNGSVDGKLHIKSNHLEGKKLVGLDGIKTVKE